MNWVKTGALLILALSAVIYVWAYAESVYKTYPMRTFSVEGTGDIDVTPDVAQFSASVMTEGGSNIVDIQSQNTEKMNKINAFLKQNGIDAKDLKTSQYNIYPRYTPCVSIEKCTANTVSGYSINQTLEVKVRDTGKVGDLLSGIVLNGANNVSDIRFVTDDQSGAKNAARQEAIAEAKKKAVELAEAGGFHVGKLVSLFESNEGMPQPYGMGGARDSQSATKASPAIEPGTNTTKVTMTLTYEIAR